MSRTYAGYLFTCKRCGKLHLMNSGEPHDGIRLPCVDFEYSVNEYEKKDFEFWHGNFYDVFDIRVQEVK